MDCRMLLLDLTLISAVLALVTGHLFVLLILQGILAASLQPDGAERTGRLSVVAALQVFSAAAIICIETGKADIYRGSGILNMFSALVIAGA